jgi:tetratricopeptide (TPR) repeat protein
MRHPVTIASTLFLVFSAVSASAVDKSDANPRFAAAHYNRAVAYRGKGQIERAIADYTQAIEINPRYANAYFSRGGTFETKGDHDRAIADFTKAIEINPQNADAYANRGLAYQAKDQIDRAIADYSKALEIIRGTPTPPLTAAGHSRRRVTTSGRSRTIPGLSKLIRRTAPLTLTGASLTTPTATATGQS